MTALKRLALRALNVPGVSGSLSALLRDRATVFMLHRFRVPDLGVSGHDPDLVRELLAHLRRSRFELVSLEEVFHRLAGDGPPLAGCVAFTLDDGYFDQVEIAGPVFAEFDCPATTFVTTGFLDGDLWFWWDRIEWIFAHTARRDLVVELGDETWSGRWQDETGRDASRDAFVAACKRVPDGEKHRAIESLAVEAGVECPTSAPAAYAPMSWADLRAWEQRGMQFGAHTVTHPVLARTDDSQSRRELVEGWARLSAESANPSRVFCYPNGQIGDFGDREIGVLRELGMIGAVVGEPGYASAPGFAASPSAPFEVRRFSLPDRLEDLLQLVSGFERLKQIVRREDAA